VAASSPRTSLSLLKRLCDPADAEAWRRLVQLYTPLLQRWLRLLHLQPADADDVSQRILEVLLRKLPEFEHSGRVGAFRTWLRHITVNAVRSAQHATPPQALASDDILEQLAASDSDWVRRWDREHDEHVLSGLLEQVRPEFSDATWQAFRRLMLDETPAEQVAAELGISVNAVRIAKSRVLNRLRQEAAGLVEE
jgi:RNA polymerase sigma-70 factor (ECF subfamily)